MDSKDLFQYLIPVIFLIVWAIGRVFSGKKKEDSEAIEPANPPVRPNDSFEDIYSYPLEETIETRHITDKTRLDLVAAALDQHKESLSRSQGNEVRGLNRQSAPADAKTGAQQAELRAWLHNSNAVKRAFVTSEILGAPVALRQNGKMGPRWDQ